MTTITINNLKYKTHPIFTLYAASRRGDIIHIVKQKPHFGNKMNKGYMMCRVRQFGESGFKHYLVHKFIWETFNGKIPEGKQVDHKNDIRDDNRLENLQLLSPSQNCKKSMKNRKTFNNRKNRKTIKSINMKTKEISYYFSMHSASQHLNICNQSIRDVCEKITKSALSKKDNCWYKFEYIKDDLPVNYIKSANKRPRKKTDQQIKERIRDYQTKDWQCDFCKKVLQNNSKYQHRKRCN